MAPLIRLTVRYCGVERGRPVGFEVCDGSLREEAMAIAGLIWEAVGAPAANCPVTALRVSL